VTGFGSFGGTSIVRPFGVMTWIRPLKFFW
jgi:hypothetical protein